MISKYYPDTGNSLATAISICTRAWFEHDSVGYEESSNESPIATYFATIFADNIYIGEVYKDKKFRCPELTEDLVKSVWVPIIFYETTSPIMVDKDKLYVYLRIYQWAINNFTSHREGKICAIFSKYHREYIDTIDPIHTMKVMNNNYLRSKFKRKGDKQVTLYEFQYMFQDEYHDILERLVKYSESFKYGDQDLILHSVGEEFPINIRALHDGFMFYHGKKRKVFKYINGKWIEQVSLYVESHSHIEDSEIPFYYRTIKDPTLKRNIVELIRKNNTSNSNKQYSYPVYIHDVEEDDIKNDYFPPIDPPEGYKWLNEADGTIYEYIKIGPLGMWKPMTDHKEDKSSFPSNPRQGGYFYNTEDGRYYKYIDDDWIPVPPIMLEV